MSADDLPDAPNRGLAQAKAIGTDVESLVVDALDPLDHADDPDAHHDAETTALLAPETVSDVDVPVVFVGVPLVESDTDVEIKACARTHSNGTRDIHGRWTFKGKSEGQHGELLDRGAVYVLAVYQEHENGTRELVAIAVVPAALLDDRLRGSWYTIDRREGTLARLSWHHVIPDEGGETGCR